MKTEMKTILAMALLGAGLTLSSCVSPYEGPSSVTTYRTGYRVNSLPSNHRTETIAGTNYYYHDGAYFQRRDNSYVVVDAPRRSRYYDEYSRYGNQTVRNYSDGRSRVITDLPSGYTTVDYGGEPYYRYQDNYYRRQGSGYVTVANPF